MIGALALGVATKAPTFINKNFHTYKKMAIFVPRKNII